MSARFHQLLTLNTLPNGFKSSYTHFRSTGLKIPAISGANYSTRFLTRDKNTVHILSTTPSRHVCKMSGSDMISQLELGRPEEKQKPDKHVNGIFWILLLNLGVYVADHWFHVQNHLSSNLFFLYIFGKLVEEEEGNFALWTSYILTGAGANLVSWLVLPRNTVSVGASGAVFGLFAISVLVKMSWDWRKILEVLILGQFVIKKVMEAAQASTGLSGTFGGGYALQNVNHIAHLSGALIGVVLVWLLSRVPSHPPDQKASTLSRKTDTRTT